MSWEEDKMRAMSEFAPTKRATVHDTLTGQDFAWQPEWAEHYREHRILEGRGYRMGRPLARRVDSGS